MRPCRRNSLRSGSLKEDRDEYPGAGKSRNSPTSTLSGKPEALGRCLDAIHDLVAYVRANERYEVWHERSDPTRFVHLFIFRDAAASQIHSRSAEVNKFASILYPECLAPVEFIDYSEVDSNAPDISRTPPGPSGLAFWSNPAAEQTSISKGLVLTIGRAAGAQMLPRVAIDKSTSVCYTVEGKNG